MIRILDRLVARTFLKLFLVFLTATPLMFILGDVTENLDTCIDRGLTGAEVFRAYVYELPMFVLWGFPLAALIAAVFTVHGMTTHREIVAAKAGGISFHRVVRPVMVLGILLTGAALVLTEVVPRGKRVAEQILRAEDPRGLWRSNFVYQSENGMTWQVGRLTASDRRMTEVILEQRPRQERSGIHMTAAAAVYDSTGWTFQQGYVRKLQPDSTEHTYQFERMRMAGLVEQPEELLEAPREPEEMTYKELDRQARIVERSGGNALELRVKQEQKISIPVATLVVILFGLPLATSTRRGGTAYGIGLSLGTTILYMMVMRIAAALGEAGALAPPTAAWLPNALFFAAALVLLVRVRT